MARYPGRAMACQLIRPAPPTSKAALTGEVLSEAGRPQRKVFLHPTDTVVRQRDPLRQVSQPPRVGSQALLDRFRVSAGLRKT